MKKNWTTMEKGFAALLVATTATYGTACMQDSGSTGGLNQAPLSKSGAEVRALGIAWYQLSIDGLSVSTNLLDEEKKVVGTFVLDPESSASHSIHITMEGFRGEAVLTQSKVVYDDGIYGEEIVVSNEHGSFQVNVQDETLYFVHNGERIEINSDPVNVERLNVIGGEPSVAAVLNDPRFKLAAAIGKDGEFSHAFEDAFFGHHDESGIGRDSDDSVAVSTYEVHGTPACQGAVQAATALCVACVAAAVATGVPTLGTGTIVVGAVCTILCGTSLGLIIECVWASNVAPTDADCALEAATNLPSHDGVADETNDECIYICNSLKCDAHCKQTHDKTWTGACIEDNVCSCRQLAELPVLPAPGKLAPRRWWEDEPAPIEPE